MGRDARPTTIMDNSLLMAEGELDERFKVVRWRPGLYAIHEIEETNFYIGLNLKNKEFRSAEELNEYLRELTASGHPVPKVPPKTPFEQAQALVYETIGAPRKKRIEKCREAIRIHPNCADALLILSEYETDPGAKREMLDKAVLAGEALLREAGMDEWLRRVKEGLGESGRGRVVSLQARRVGRSDKPQGPATAPSQPHGGPVEGTGEIEPEPLSLWIGEGRSYLRAKAARAQYLYQAGDRRLAIEEYRSLLALDPLDHLGIRYLLVSALLKEGGARDISEAAAMVRSVRDSSPLWAWTDAFLAIMNGSEHGTQDVPQAIIRAYYLNPHVPRVLQLGARGRRALPETSGYGTEEEAIIYGWLAAEYWTRRPGALRRLEEAIDRITGGLPFPFGAEAQSFHERVAQLWGASLSQAARQDVPYIRALQDHPEFRNAFIAFAVSVPRFTIGDADPYEHIKVQAAVESVLSAEGAVSEGMRRALDAAMNAGLSRHEAVHLLTYMYAFEWVVAEDGCAPLDVDTLQGHLRWVERLASGESGPDIFLSTPSRNDPCPCGSGRKFKKCCGKHEAWPIPPVESLTRALAEGRGKLRSRRGLGLSAVLGFGLYAPVGELMDLPSDHPLVILDNTAAVARALLEQGREFQAIGAVEDNVDLAMTLEDKEALTLALRDATALLTALDGYNEDLARYACALARVTSDSREACHAWAMAAKAFMQADQMAQAEQALRRAMSDKDPGPRVKTVWASYLARVGRRDEAIAAYRQVIKDCESRSEEEYNELAKQARDEVRILERRSRR